MSYRYDSYLVIANKLGGANADAKAQLFETYDKLRDITVSGSSGVSSGAGFDTAGGFLYNLATLFSPASFMTTLNGGSSYTIPGTSYWSSGMSATGSSSNGLESYTGFPSGAAPVGWGLSGCATGEAASILTGFGSDNATGFASSVGGIADIASAAAYGAGTASGGSGIGSTLLLNTAGLVAGWGGIMQAAAPYLGEYGLPAIVMGNLMQGTGSAALGAYQNITGRITANADTILSNKVRNIETVCKMLDTQGDVVKKMLKESIDGDSKAIQNL